MCCVWSVTGKGVSHWSHKISDGQLCYLWGGGWVEGLMEPRMVVVRSCTSMQCFNTLLVLSFHTVDSSLGGKCFSVLHSALISSVQGSRTSWSDYIFFWGLVWSEKTYREDCPNPISITTRCMVTDSLINSLHLIQCFIFPDLSLSWFCWVKPRIVCQFAFLFSCPLSCLASALLSSAVTAGSCSSPGFTGSSSTLGLGFLLLLETAPSFQWTPAFHLLGSLACPPQVQVAFLWPVFQLFSAWLSHPSCFCLSEMIFPFLRCVSYLFSLLLPDRTAFDLMVSKSVGLCRHVPWNSPPQTHRPITDSWHESQML